VGVGQVGSPKPKFFLVSLVTQILPLCSKLASYPQNYWLSGPIVPRYPQEYSGKDCPWKLKRRQQLRQNAEWLKH
jgi:hypothetical protein